MKTLDIVTYCYPGDYGWLPYFFRAITKHASGFRKLLLVIDEQSPAPPDLPDFVELMFSRSLNDVPYGRTILRFEAWKWTDSELISFIDSDCMLARPTNLVEWSSPQIPMLVTPWELLSFGKEWRPVTEKILGFPPPYETMRQYPFVYPRDMLQEAHGHIGGFDRVLKLLVTGEIDRVSEFNVWGNYGIVKHPELFRVERTDRPPITHGNIYHFWPRKEVDSPEMQLMLQALDLLP